MRVKFRKMHGAGNDFIVINDLKGTFPVSQPLISGLCDRRLGVGADGLILIQSSEEYDFRMVYFNSDGREGSMCGNGGRTASVFAMIEKIAPYHAVFEAYDGLHRSEIQQIKQNLFDVTISMKDVTSVKSDDKSLITNTGSPHFVLLHDNVAEIDVVQEGRKIRNRPQFRDEGINVNFLEQKDQSFFLRTYERGVEDETLSCGTGVTAAAIAVNIWFQMEQISLVTRGGEFSVHLRNEGGKYMDISLRGPVTMVFEGFIDL